MMNVQAVLAHAAQLWPQGRLTEAEAKAWAGSLAHIGVDTEQAIAVLNDVRVDRGRRSPPIAVINRRLKEIVETEARGRAADSPKIPEAAIDFESPQGYVVEAIREWYSDANHLRFRAWREKAKGLGMIEMLRKAWKRWTGTEGPYGRHWYENDQAWAEYELTGPSKRTA